MKRYEGSHTDPDGAGPGTVIVVEGERDGLSGSYPLPHEVRHSPDGFNWGYGGSGPAELARCILLDFFGDDEGYQDFKWKVIARLPSGKSWTIYDTEIAEWKARYKREAA